MLAVAGGHVDAVSLLLEKEASVNVTNNHGFTALHLGVTVQLQEILGLVQNILNEFWATIFINTQYFIKTSWQLYLDSVDNLLGFFLFFFKISFKAFKISLRHIDNCESCHCVYTYMLEASGSSVEQI